MASTLTQSVGDTTRSRRPPTGPRLYERTATRAFRFLTAFLVVIMAAQCQSFFPLTIVTAFPLRRHLAAGEHRAGHVQGRRRRLPARWASSSPSGEPQHPPKPAKRRRPSGGGAAAGGLPSERSAGAFADHRAALSSSSASASLNVPVESTSPGLPGPPAVSLSLPWMLRLEDTSRRLEGQVRDLTTAVQTLQRTVDRTTRALQAAQNQAQVQSQAGAAAATAGAGGRPTGPTGRKTARLFIDGTWLYYSLYERETEFCPMARRFGRDWVLRYTMDWARIPGIVERAMFGDGGGGGSPSTSDGDDNEIDRPSPASRVEIVSSTVFTSYRPETSPSSFRYKMFDGLKRAGYDVHMMETLGEAEKCVDIALAVELLHADCDVAILLTGDKDFLPAMARTRSPTRKLGLVTMRRSCNRALYEDPVGVILDYNVVWLDDYIDQFVVPMDQLGSGAATGGGGGPPVLSLFTVIKILNDFIAKSPVGRVSSRDVGRYLKSLELDSSTTVSDEVKRGFGGLRHLLRMLKDVYRINVVNSEAREDGAFPFMIELVEGTASQRLQAEAKKAELSAAEKRFFDQYSLRELDDVPTAYQNTLQLLAASGINGFDDPSKKMELSKGPSTPDYSEWKVEQLKDLCRERNLPVTVRMPKKERFNVVTVRYVSHSIYLFAFRV
jgi:NYN domain